MHKIIQLWYGFWIRLAYLLRLRNVANAIQQWLVERHIPKSKLESYESPEDLVASVRKRFNWRKDQTRVGGLMVPLDWISDPKTFQTRLTFGSNQDGDCDDYHAYCCNRLQSMGIDSFLCSVGYPGGGHVVCCFENNGKKYLINYGLQEIQDFNDVPQMIAEWGTKDGKKPKVYWYLFERYPEFKIMALCPWGKIKS